jgi:hypothetical protein
MDDVTLDMWQGGGVWKITMNQELGELHKTNDLEEHNKRNTLEWVGHVIRLDQTRVAKIFFRRPSSR